MHNSLMKRSIKRWLLRILTTGVFLAGSLIIIILNPSLLYANKTKLGNYTIYHNQPLDGNFRMVLDNATTILKSSELYDPALKMDICLNDGSY